MGTITVPGNPYQGGVTPNAVRGLGTLHAMPDSKWRTDKIVAGATDKIVSAVDKWQAETDKTLVQDAINQSKSELEDLKSNPEEGWGNLTGSNALNRPDGKSLSEEYLEKGRALFANRRGQLKTDRQRKMYDLYSQAAYQQLGAELQSHMVKQQAVFEKATHAATFNTATNDVLNGIQSGDMDRANSGYAVAMSELQWQADKSGLPVDVPKLMDTVNSNAIGIFIEGKNPAAARAWLKAHKDDMSAEQVAKSEKLIKAGQQKQDVEFLVSKVLATSGSDADILKAMHEATKGKDAEVRQDVTTKVRQKLAERDWEKRIRAADLKTTLQKMVANGEELPETGLQDLDDLDPKAANEIRDMVMTRSYASLPTSSLLGLRGEIRTKDGAKAIEAVIKARLDDPVGTAIGTGAYGFEPLNLNDTQQVVNQLQHRVAQAETLQKDWMVAPRLLSKAETSDFITALDNADVNKRCQLLSMFSQAVGPEGSGILFRQLGPKNSVYGTAMYLMSMGDTSLGNHYLLGKDFIAQGIVPLPKTGEGSEGDFNGRMQRDGKVGALTNNNDLMKMWADAAQGVWAYGQRAGSSLNAGKALEQVLGGQIVDWNGKRIVTPYNEYTKRGYDKSSIFATSFDDLLERKIGALKDDKTKVITGITGRDRTTVGAIASDFKTMQLETVGDGKYRIIDPNSLYGYVMQDLGNDTMIPYVLDVMDVK